jgi:hypothetical protein
LTILLLVFATDALPAAESTPHVFGSYAVMHATSAGRDTRVELRLRLVNPSAQAVSIERLAVFYLHPAAAKLLTNPILVEAHTTQEISQEFTIPTPEYELWQKGMRPSLHMEMRTQEGGRLSQTVRLNRMLSGEAK